MRSKIKKPACSKFDADGPEKLVINFAWSNFLILLSNIIIMTVNSKLCSIMCKEEKNAG